MYPQMLCKPCPFNRYSVGVVVMVGFSSSTYTVPEDVNVDICLTTNIGNDELIPVLIFTAPKSATRELYYSCEVH